MTVNLTIQMMLVPAGKTLYRIVVFPGLTTQLYPVRGNALTAEHHHVTVEDVSVVQILILSPELNRVDKEAFTLFSKNTCRVRHVIV